LEVLSCDLLSHFPKDLSAVSVHIPFSSHREEIFNSFSFHPFGLDFSCTAGDVC